MFIAVRFALLTLLLGGLVYPLMMVGIGQALFPKQASGSFVQDAQGHVVGSSLIAQAFTSAGYFHPRPSANNYDGTNSGGSNDGPTSKKLIDRVRHNTEAYLQENKFSGPVPVDAVTTSSSSLDPDITLANAYLQAPRVAEARKVSLDQVKTLISQTAETNNFGFLSNPNVNVLKLNLALDSHR